MGLEGINSDRRPRDWGYAVVFEEKELPSLEQMIKQVNQTHNTDLIEGFNQRCEERIKEGDPAVTKSEDLVTNLGLQACISLILGTSITTWTSHRNCQSCGPSCDTGWYCEHCREHFAELSLTLRRLREEQ